MKSADGGLAVVAYAPCVVKTEVQGKPVTLEIKTGYPFRDTVELVVTVPEPIMFPIYLRYPDWTSATRINVDAKLGRYKFVTSPSREDPEAKEESLEGMGGHELLVGHPASFDRIDARWDGTASMRIQFIYVTPDLVRGHRNAISIVHGPLVYALSIPGEWKKVIDRPSHDFDDWEVHPKAAWNYALVLDPTDAPKGLSFEEQPLAEGTSPFVTASAPMIARVKGRKLPGWTIENAAAQEPPQSPVTSDQPIEDLTLVPYGLTDLRVTEFPWLRP
jgi:hypothetical protein